MTNRSPEPPDGRPPGRADDAPASESLALLQRAKSGDAEALSALVRRYRPALARWASGRLPRAARDLAETSDLVQETLVQTLKKIGSFEPRHEGALQGYLRQALLNRIRDELRRARRRPPFVELAEENVDPGASPLEAAIGSEALDRYEAALQRLKPGERDAIVARVELDCSYEELAVALGKPSVDAARMAVARALVRLAEEMKR